MPGNDEFTLMLLHMNGEDESTNFIDDAIGGDFTWTAFGDAQIDIAQSVFGGASGLFAYQDYIQGVLTTPIEFGSGDFTIDFWFRRANSGDGAWKIFRLPNNDYEPLFIEYYAEAADADYLYLFFEATDNSWCDVMAYWETDKLDPEVWYHVAFVRDGATLRLFIDGVQIETSSVGTKSLPAYSIAPQLGLIDWGEGFSGWIDEFRVSKGVARWTENFTPPEEEYGGGLSYVGNIPINLGIQSDYQPSVYIVEKEMLVRSIIRATKGFGSPPVIKGRNPMPGQTAVERNRKVEFLLACADGDEVDLDSIAVTIDGVLYEIGDPEFSYSGPGDRRLISVAHPVFGYEQRIDVAVEAGSKLGGSMIPEAYHYMTEWHPDLTREK